MTDLLQRLEQNIQTRGLFKRGEKILVAVSGGLDSMALLRALKELSAKHRWKIVVAHFNHQLRGRASVADERLVRQTAAAMRLRIIGESANVKAFATKSRLSLEMAARKLRHEFLARAARRNKIHTIALAHQSDDQVELFFLRLLRGAGGDGLAGMKWHSPSPADTKITLVRPLLGFTKAELLTFATENRIRFREDATNFSSDFLRNQVRNELLPQLREKYQPKLNKIILRLMEIVGTESDLVGDMARLWLRRDGRGAVHPNTNRRWLAPAVAISNRGFEKSPIAIQRRILQWQLLALGVTADFDLIESLRQSTNVFISVGPNISVSRNAGGKVNLRAEQISRFKDDSFIVKLNRAGEVIFGGPKLQWQIRPQEAFSIPQKTRALECFDADKVGGEIRLRHWHPGDRFQPIGSESAAKLQDLFTNAKIPRDRRRNLVVAANADKEIFWVEGLRIGEHFKLTPQTRRQLVWRWRRKWA